MIILIFNVLILLLIQQKINFVKACTCLIPVKDVYCRSNWAAHILIIKSETIKEGLDKPDWKIRYTAKFLKIFKDDKDCECTKNNYLFTSANDSLCGVYLQNDTEYLNFGYYLNGERYIGVHKWKETYRCGYNIELNYVPEEIEKDLNNEALNDYCKLKTTTTPKI